MIPGHATSEGTARFFNFRGELGGWLEATGLHCSRVGFGGYRVDDETPAHSHALKSAILNGCNLIDTSTNYTDGGSERMIGGVLAELTSVGVVDRNQMVVVSKVGYVQGQALEQAQARETQGRPYPEMVKYQDGCWHCLHPEFLEVQFDNSRKRLGLETLDCYLLHNPEYFLMDAANRGSSVMLDGLRAQFYERIERAFEFLETKVQAGQLQGYGVSSNTLGAPAGRADATSLSAFWETAERVGKKLYGDASGHHFQVAQLPLNLFESGPVLEKNTGAQGEVSALEFASKHGLGVLANRPLNAFTHQHLVRLADFPPEREGTQDPRLQRLLERLRRMGAEVTKVLNPLLPETWRGETLSRKALGVLIQTPGVSCVLNGMRTSDYVHDSMGAVKLPRLSSENVQKIYEAFA